MTKERKTEIIKNFGRDEKDTVHQKYKLHF